MKKIIFSLLVAFLAISCTATEQKETEKVSDVEIKVGMAGYTFVNFDIDTTLDMLKQLDIHYLCIKDFHLPLNSTVEEMDAFKAKLAASDVIGYGVGPIYMKTEEAVDQAFEYVKRLGVKVLVGVPSYEMLPYVNQKVQEYDVKLAIHLHGPDQEQYQNASVVWDKVKDLDPRMGICLDIGHNLRTGDDPADDILKYHSRIFDIHIKDVTAASKAGIGIELGRGLIDFPRLVDALREVKYEGSCSLEYEKDMKAPFIGIAQSIGYFKGIIDATAQ